MYKNRNDIIIRRNLYYKVVITMANLSLIKVVIEDHLSATNCVIQFLVLEIYYTVTKTYLSSFTFTEPILEQTFFFQMQKNRTNVVKGSGN